MTDWKMDELEHAESASELQIATLRRDGTLRKRVTIWVVRVDDDLYVRSYRGQAGAWYRHARVSRKGRIWMGGVEKDVTLVDESNFAINDRIDAAYRSKYGRYPQYVAPMVTPDVRSTTMKLVPQ